MGGASMGSPREHLTWVSRMVTDHERRVAELREGTRLAEQEIAFQQILVELGHNARLLMTRAHDRLETAAVGPEFHGRHNSATWWLGHEGRQLSVITRERSCINRQTGVLEARR